MILIFLAAFFITFALTPVLKGMLERRGITGTDLHKANRPKIPEMGGIAILPGFSVPVIAGYLFYQDVRLLVGLAVVLLVGGLGIVDGFKRLSPLQKVVPLTVAGAILIPFSKPSISGYELGILYLIFVPVFFMFACNFTNMLAGFNGLEIGTGAIASFGMALVAYINCSVPGVILSLAMFGALLAFLYYNRYPAKIFPGDVGTLIIGAALFTSMILSKAELAGAVIFIPYIADAALKYLSVGIMTRESQKPTQLREGKLYIPKDGNMSLVRLFLRRRPMAEKEVVIGVWAMEAVFVTIAVMGTLL
ncbi:MAG: hypothetical protein V3R93_00335 [Candidatus Hydrothermarchaeaceae archaeon]